jgi:hypothetical protein
MQIKEEIHGVNGRRRSKRTIDDDEYDDEDDYSEEPDHQQQAKIAGTKRTRGL